jgi:hypothetical protein
MNGKTLVDVPVRIERCWRRSRWVALGRRLPDPILGVLLTLAVLDAEVVVASA